ncbi:MAG: hypothetical protein ACKV2Q_13550 [Planctomycetaceae bacterium]
MDARPSPDQYGLDFTSRQNELIALVSGLSRVPLMIDGKRLSMGRVYGVIDLLKRLFCLVPHGEPIGRDRVAVVAQVPYLGQRMTSFRCVAERTVRDWSRDARALGLVEVNYRSHELGGRHWNEWSVRLDVLRDLGGSGRQRAAMVADPLIRVFNSGNEMNSRPGPVCAGPARSNFDSLPDWRELLPIRDAIVDPISDEQLANLSACQRAWLAGKRAFEPLTERWLSHESDLEFWHRWQLRNDPVVGATQAHFALVLATARHAVAFPKARLKRNRVALFVGLIAKRNWEPVRSRLEGVLHDMLVPT